MIFFGIDCYEPSVNDVALLAFKGTTVVTGKPSIKAYKGEVRLVGFLALEKAVDAVFT